MVDNLMNHIDKLRKQGFLIVPEYVPAIDFASATSELSEIYPSATDFHSDPFDQEHSRYQGDEFAGIRTFPFGGVELNLLAVHPHLIDLAEQILDTTDIRIYSCELWAKYTGAADYDQLFHRDYLNHTLMVPSSAAAQDQVEMFLYLVDVPDVLGPPHFVSKELTKGEPSLPNWLSREERPEWYNSEVSAAGPAGTVIAYGIDTFHRGTGLTQVNGARFTIHASFRRASTEWALRVPWANHAHEKAWYNFVAKASVRQLLLFGFPPPGHEFWTPEALENTALRYPDLDITQFRRKN